MLPFLGRTFLNPVPSVRNPLSTFRAALRTALISATLLLASNVWADDYADISKSIRAGQFTEALNKVDAALVKTPKDAQLRFLKGLIYTETNKSAEAIVIFTKMTEDFPDLPEPYNNLAVLYASSGQYDKARVALEAAIRTHPSYATAYENLGDVYAKLASQAYDRALQGENYAKLASQAYDKALQLDANNQGTKKKLALVNTMSKTGSAVRADAAAATSAKAAQPAASPTPTAVAKAKAEADAKAEARAKAEQEAKAKADSLAAEKAKAEALAQEKARAKADAKADSQATEKAKAEALALEKAKAKSDAKADAKAEALAQEKAKADAAAEKKAKADALAQEKAKAKADAKPAADADEEDALRTLQTWARAWSSKDVKTYLNSYASDFQTPKGESRKSWAEERRTRIESKGRINVQIEAAQVSVENNTATIKFRQMYKSDKLSSTSRKTIVLVKQGGRWLIKQEHSAS
jgi:hypothetical protein